MFVTITDADKVAYKHLKEYKLPAVAEHFAQALGMPLDLDTSALPSLPRLLELWEATHGSIKPVESSLGDLSLSSTLSIPERPTLNLCVSSPSCDACSHC